MTSSLKAGDKVKWDTSQGQTTGKVVRKITGTAHVAGHEAKASKAHPQYEVESSKTGKKAIHKPDALKRV